MWFLAGFVFGVLVIGSVSLLVFWAVSHPGCLTDDYWDIGMRDRD